MGSASKQAISVSAVSRFIQTLFKEHMAPIWIQGEVCNLKANAQGMIFFSLRDEHAMLHAWIPKGSLATQQANLKDGDAVCILGSLSYYSKKGSVSCLVTDLQVQKDQAGLLFEQLQQLKQKLQAEGLFAQKRPLPSYPARVAVITSRSGAALHDILHVFERRYPSVEIYLFPAVVQGNEAPSSLVRALHRVQKCSSPLDLLIIGRGGGSSEDLSAFNDESVARALFACAIPSISAVGHEIDTSIVDLVADKRAPTPSAAAEIASPDTAQLLNFIEKNQVFLRQRLDKKIQALQERCQHLHVERFQQVIASKLDLLSFRLQNAQTACHTRIQTQWQTYHQCIQTCRSKLDILNPDRILQKGFSITRLANGEVLRSCAQIAKSSTLFTTVADGTIRSTVSKPTSSTMPSQMSSSPLFPELSTEKDPLCR